VALGVAGGGASELQWVHANHLGTPILTTNASGQAVTSYGYAAIGFPGQFANALLLPGAEHYYNRYRDYDPTTGRYIQADPIGLAGDANAWVYAGANPLGYTDPLGLSSGWDDFKDGFSELSGWNDIKDAWNCPTATSVFWAAVAVSPLGKVGKAGKLFGRAFKGGAFGRLASKKGVIERHHMPAKSVTSFTDYSGPAIQMDYADHLRTASHGQRGLAAAAYRREMKALIDRGNMRGAMAREIWDVRRAAAQGGGSVRKYNGATREMLDYTYGKGWITK
jgi:RHS repeat-associated protein